MTTIERWGLFEASFSGPRDGNPFQDVSLTAEFRHGDRLVEVTGFYDGEGVYRVRFLPELTGTWTFLTRSNVAALEGREGTFVCGEPSPGNHGPVRVRGAFQFAYADQDPYLPFGTTCYAWVHQPQALQAQTLVTLGSSPFNKLRMCVFPKHYDYNLREPGRFPYPGTLAQGFDFDRFDPEFFHLLERRILDLQSLGIEADLILFHPYDRWGFSDLGPARDEAYLRYVVSRLAAFRNVWWSLANEYDFFLRPDGTLKKEVADWNRLGLLVQRSDPYQHLRSIHNGVKIYDHGQPWVTHASLQRVDPFKTAENTTEWRQQFGKPVVIDECAYEGNINHGWGNISGQEMTRRFWEGFVRGGFVGHGETYVHPQDILWWSHGGELHGSSPRRIAFLRTIMESAPGPLSPVPKPVGTPFDPYWDVTLGVWKDEYHLFYFGFYQPSFRTFSLDAQATYKVEVIDTWDMTRTPLEGTVQGPFRVELPGKPYMAVLVTKVG